MQSPQPRTLCLWSRSPSFYRVVSQRGSQLSGRITNLAPSAGSTPQALISAGKSSGPSSGMSFSHFCLSLSLLLFEAVIMSGLKLLQRSYPPGALLQAGAVGRVGSADSVYTALTPGFLLVARESVLKRVPTPTPVSHWAAAATPWGQDGSPQPPAMPGSPWPPDPLRRSPFCRNPPHPSLPLHTRSAWPPYSRPSGLGWALTSPQMAPDTPSHPIITLPPPPQQMTQKGSMY